MKLLDPEQSMCETVSVSSAEVVACRWCCFLDVRKLSRPFDTESSSESESQRPKWGNFLMGSQFVPPALGTRAKARGWLPIAPASSRPGTLDDSGSGELPPGTE